MAEVITIGLDLAKSVFQVHGVDAAGRVVVRKRLSRGRLSAFFASHPPALVGIEACGSAHHWARCLQALGHEVRLMPAAYVKPYRKRNKTDARDAEAICEAVGRPTMRFVAVKSVMQQCQRSLHRTRDLLIRQRTQLVNALRGLLAEMGVVAPQGIAGAQRLMALVESRDGAIPVELLASLSPLVEQWRSLGSQIADLDRSLMAQARADAAMKRLAGIPGIGPVIAHATVAAIGEGRQFRCARDFVAWLGLTPLSASSGNTERIGAISRAGDRSLRRLFVLGAMANLRHIRGRPQAAATGLGHWLTGLLARRPVKVAAVALAAKTARIAWAVLTSGQSYRERAVAA